MTPHAQFGGDTLSNIFWNEKSTEETVKDIEDRFRVQSIKVGVQSIKTFQKDF